MKTEYLRNGFVYSGIYFKYDKIVAISNVESTNRAINNAFMSLAYYQITVQLNVTFCDGVHTMGRQKIRNKPKYAWGFWDGNLSDWFSKLRNTKQYQVDIAEYNNALSDYNQLVTDSDKILEEYLAEVTKLREIIINKLEENDEKYTVNRTQPRYP